MGNSKGNNTTSSNDGPDAENASGSADLGTHLAQTAWRVAVPFLTFSIGGIMLDRYLDTEPLFSLIGISIALLSVVLVMYKYVDKNFPGTFGGDK